MNGVAGLVLAGGRARRMGGGDKPLLPVGGVPILARIIATIAPDLSWLAISANGDPARFASYGLPVLGDGAFADEGPLAGILAGLTWAASLGAASLLTVPGDTPFLPAGLPGLLAPGPAIIRHGGREHPLVALWPVEARHTLSRTLAREGSRSARGFANLIGARQVDFVGPGTDPFLNINTPADLQAARPGLGE